MLLSVQLCFQTVVDQQETALSGTCGTEMNNFYIDRLAIQFILNFVRMNALTIAI